MVGSFALAVITNVGIQAKSVPIHVGVGLIPPNQGEIITIPFEIKGDLVKFKCCVAPIFPLVRGWHARHVDHLGNWFLNQVRGGAG